MFFTCGFHLLLSRTLLAMCWGICASCSLCLECPFLNSLLSCLLLLIKISVKNVTSLDDSVLTGLSLLCLNSYHYVTNFCFLSFLIYYYYSSQCVLLGFLKSYILLLACSLIHSFADFSFWRCNDKWHHVYS